MLKVEAVNTYVTRLFCDNCKHELKAENIREVITTYPEKYVYVCPECQKITESYSRYPIVKYESINEQDK